MIGSIASLAANVAVAEPTLTGRVIAAWPSFALIGSYELLMRQLRRGATRNLEDTGVPTLGASRAETDVAGVPLKRREPAGLAARRQAWQWAVANRDENGALPSGKAIADQYGRHERWGRLVRHLALRATSSAQRHPDRCLSPTEPVDWLWGVCALRSLTHAVGSALGSQGL